MKRYKEVFLSVFLLMLLIPLVALASYTANQYPNVPPIEKMHPNGKYIVYVEKGDKWQEAGIISCDKYFREREIDLRGYITNRGNVSIRLLHQGGGAAHIDSVFLGDRSPIEVRGIKNGLKKLSEKDFDVIDVFNKSIDITFSSDIGNSILKLTARVEDTSISKVPFQFPVLNVYKEMNLKSKFYTYEMGSRNTETPFFKEYSLSGSGHPSGYTYGWVRNDDTNLYVRIDFTPDNTMDGDKDYAKVYVKTERGIREFKVSVPETKWGEVSFVYTDKVTYQHKVYDFAIPLKEIGINDAKEADKVNLAFAAYGTATPATPLLNSTYTTAVPIIDGNYYSVANEWPSNTAEAALEISGPIHTLVYLKNDNNFLFMMVNAASVSGDYTEENQDHCTVYIYKNKKGLRVTVFGDGTKFCEATSSVSNPLIWSTITCPAGVMAADGFGPSPEKPADHRMYEFKLPLSAIGAVPGDIIYFASPLDLPGSLPFNYNSNSFVYNIWPPAATANNLNTWGQIQLGNGPSAIPSLNKWGIIIFIVLAGLGATYYMRRQKTAKSY